MKKGIYAILAVLMVCAMTMVSCGGGDSDPDPCTVSFSLNGGTGTVPASIGTYIDSVVTLPKPAADVVGPVDAPYFVAWTDGAENYNALASYTATGDVTLKAVWTATAPPPIVEEISLINGWTAIFKFTLPGGKKWEDYEKVTVDYKIADLTTKVRARMFGNFLPSEIDQVTLGQYVPTLSDGVTLDPTNAVNIAVVGSWPGGDSGSWIINNNNWAGPTAADTIFGDKATSSTAGAVAGVLEDATWFTVDYGKPATSSHGQFNNKYTDNDVNKAPKEHPESVGDYFRYKAGRDPANDATGSFYLGLGLSNNSDAVVTSQIKNVILVGKTGTPNLIGTPVYFEKSGVKYRAYNGQLEARELKDADNQPFVPPQYEARTQFTQTQGGRPGWKVIEGEDQINAIPYNELSDITITYDLNLPAGATAAGDAPAALTLYPGSRLGNAQLVTPAMPSGPSGYVFKGWYTAATDGIKIIDRYQFDESAAIYAQWSIVADPAFITYDVKGATGSVAQAVIDKGGKLSAAQLGKGSLTNGTKQFGGWWLADPSPAAGTDDDYTKIVTTNTTFDATNTTIYAYWYDVPDTTVKGIKVEALGGGRIDKNGYVIFGNNNENAWLNSNANATLLSFKFPAGIDKDSGKTVKITYEFKSLLDPVIASDDVSAGWVKDAAYIWKNGYNSWSDTAVTGGPSRFGNFKTTGDTITRDTKYFEGSTAGVSIQINGGDDANNKQKRVGYVYGIKVTDIVIE